MSWCKLKETDQQIMDKTAKKVMRELRAEYRRRIVLQTIRSGPGSVRRKPSVSIGRFKQTWYLPEGIPTDFLPQKRLFSRIRAWIQKRRIRKQFRRIPVLSDSTQPDKDV